MTTNDDVTVTLSRDDMAYLYELQYVYGTGGRGHITDALREAMHSGQLKPGICQHCRHAWDRHDQLMQGEGDRMISEYNPYQVSDIYACNAGVGMGEACYCTERSRMQWLPEGPRGYPVPAPLEPTP